MTKITKEALGELTKAQLAQMLTDLEITFDTGINKDEMVDLVLANHPDAEEQEIEEVDLDKIVKPQSDAKQKKQLELKLAQVTTQASELNDVWTGLKTPEERQAFVDSLDEEIPGLADAINGAFTESFDDPIAQDLPNSEIISNIPVRVMEQILASVSINYPLMGMVDMQTIRNGIKEIFYQDYRDADDTSAWSDVALKDFNPGVEPIFKETFKASVNIHKAFAMLANELNDITFSMGLFVSLVKNYAIAIARPLAKALYSRFITFLDTDASYDEVLNFTDITTISKGKDLKSHFISMATPSRDNLKVMPKGSATPLEYAMDLKNMHMVVNKGFSSDYTYDVLTNSFNIGKVTYNVKSITELDFVKLGKYSAKATTPGVDLAKKEILLIEDKAYFEFKHFDADKSMETPKLKKVIHSYTRVVNGRRKDKYIGAFEPKASA